MQNDDFDFFHTVYSLISLFSTKIDNNSYMSWGDADASLGLQTALDIRKNFPR